MQVEYLVINYKDGDEKVTLSLRQADILTALAQDEELRSNGGCVPDLQEVTNNKSVNHTGSEGELTIQRGSSLPVFHPEFGRFMLEATPGKPWGIGFKDLLDVEPNMKWR
jgi:glutamate--cysteine ligase catalytic subunit